MTNGQQTESLVVVMTKVLTAAISLVKEISGVGMTEVVRKTSLVGMTAVREISSVKTTGTAILVVKMTEVRIEISSVGTRGVRIETSPAEMTRTRSRVGMTRVLIQ